MLSKALWLGKVLHAQLTGAGYGPDPPVRAVLLTDTIIRHDACRGDQIVVAIRLWSRTAASGGCIPPSKVIDAVCQHTVRLYDPLNVLPGSHAHSESPWLPWYSPVAVRNNRTTYPARCMT